MDGFLDGWMDGWIACARLQGLVASEERFMFNQVENDDDRECHVCKTTCFLSALYCPLDSGEL